jgi:hypothetical protein
MDNRFGAKMTIEKTIERLKKLHSQYEGQVQSLTAQRDHINTRLEEVMTRAVQTRDAIAALEGTPKVAEILKNALTEYQIPNPGHVGEKAAFAPAPTETLPPPEPGYHWAKNDLGEDILLPDHTPEAIIATPSGGIVLPVIEDEDFRDSPADLIF